MPPFPPPLLPNKEALHELLALAVQFSPDDLRVAMKKSPSNQYLPACGPASVCTRHHFRVGGPLPPHAPADPTLTHSSVDPRQCPTRPLPKRRCGHYTPIDGAQRPLPLGSTEITLVLGSPTRGASREESPRPVPSQRSRASSRRRREGAPTHMPQTLSAAIGNARLMISGT